MEFPGRHYIYATDISEQSAVLTAEVPIVNHRATDESVEARIEVRDETGVVVLTNSQTSRVAAGAAMTCKISGMINQPKLWEPGAHPHLYEVNCLLLVAGHVIDRNTIAYGIRSARWDVRSGLTLNNHPLKLRGWGQKPTNEWPGLGSALPDWLHFYTLQLMQQAGANFVRWGHCAGAPACITAADQLGLITDQPGVDCEFDTQGSAWRLRADSFRDVIIYFRNHPSILIWEGGNQKVSHDHAQELKGLMNEYDPHGGRVYTHRRADEITAEFMDIGIGTEGGAEIPRLPTIEGEYNREESPRRVWDDSSPPNFGYIEAKGQLYQLPSEQFAINQVSHFFQTIGKKYKIGGANWIFSDTTSGGRVNVEVSRASGEVDGVRLPKEAYFVCQVLFSPEPKIHIIGHWDYPSGTKKTIYVASNCEKVELSLNGHPLKLSMVGDNSIHIYPNIAWESGELKAVGYRNGQIVATDVRRTNDKPYALKLTPILSPSGFKANGADIALFDIEVVDKLGNRCTTEQKRIDFQIDGPGVWRGGYNSGKAQSTNNQFLEVECGINRVALRAGRQPGKITITATSEGLLSATSTVATKEIPDVNALLGLDVVDNIMKLFATSSSPGT